VYYKPHSQAYPIFAALTKNNPIFNKCYSLEGTFGPFVQGRREMIHWMPTKAMPMIILAWWWTHLPVPPFLLMQKLSPKATARSRITRWKDLAVFRQLHLLKDLTSGYISEGCLLVANVRLNWAHATVCLEVLVKINRLHFHLLERVNSTYTSCSL